MDRITISVNEAAQMLGVSRPTLYGLMKNADFPAFKLGGRRLISRDGLIKWIADQEGGTRSETTQN